MDEKNAQAGKPGVNRRSGHFQGAERGCAEWAPGLGVVWQSRCIIFMGIIYGIVLKQVGCYIGRTAAYKSFISSESIHCLPLDDVL